MEQIYRLHYRAQLKKNYAEAELAGIVEACRENIRVLQQEGRILTAALYYHERMLFLYYEALGAPLEVAEPLVLHNVPMLSDEKALAETGEDVQITTVHPKEFLAPLTPCLMKWPGQQEDRLWVHMYHIYYHDIPKSVEYWRRPVLPGKRIGRIAFLRDDKVFSYVYYHRAIVEEGLLNGDRYHSIALHENILFSYLEEPRTFKNIRDTDDEESQVIESWMEADPESHFIHMPQGEGENFMFLPALFAMGEEDL